MCKKNFGFKHGKGGPLPIEEESLLRAPQESGCTSHFKPVMPVNHSPPHKGVSVRKGTMIITGPRRLAHSFHVSRTRTTGAFRMKCGNNIRREESKILTHTLAPDVCESFQVPSLSLDDQNINPTQTSINGIAQNKLHIVVCIRRAQLFSLDEFSLVSGFMSPGPRCLFWVFYSGRAGGASVHFHARLTSAVGRSQWPVPQLAQLHLAPKET